MLSYLDFSSRASDYIMNTVEQVIHFTIYYFVIYWHLYLEQSTE